MSVIGIIYDQMRELGYLPEKKNHKSRYGHWIKADNPSSSPFVPGSEWVYICSECETTFDDDWNYCPNCGAKMEDKPRNNKRDTFSK